VSPSDRWTPPPVAATAAKELLIDVSEGKLTVASVVVKENSPYVCVSKHAPRGNGPLW